MRDHEELLYDVLACGTGDTINMIETKAFEAQESDIQEAFTHALEELKKIQAFQEEIVKKIGKTKRVIDLSSPAPELQALFDTNIAPKVVDAIFTGTPGKGGIGTLSKEWQKLVAEKLPDANKAHVEDIFEHAIDECLHKEAVEHDRRPDGRKMDEVRPLFAEARGVVTPMIHGAGVFYRGGTHVFTALTLGGPGDTLIVDSIEEQEGKKRFMHHYNFPPFSVGETGRLGGMNRRAIGHGALAEKALSAVIPPKAEFPYTIRLVSESMASNGSTSMASVCASTLALMDGGVPILRPVAGIAVGLMTVGEKYKVLTDIQGPEDHHGDMDFKVAGTEKGVTAIQMDVKVQGLTLTVLKEALEQGKKARIHILKTLTDAIAAPRSDISPHAPKILTLQIKKEQIGLVIGPGGKTINGIRDDTLVDDITIEENGLVFITGRHGTAEKARDMIADLTHEYIAGEKFEGEVTRILDFGAFVKIGRNTEGLVHISEIAPFHIANVRDALTEGEKVSVIIKEIDDKNRVNLSIKRADPDFATRKGLTQNGKAPR
jgi:polyribonucleotide nucleotidyltransferase